MLPPFGERFIRDVGDVPFEKIDGGNAQFRIQGRIGIVTSYCDLLLIKNVTRIDALVDGVESDAS